MGFWDSYNKEMSRHGISSSRLQDSSVGKQKVAHDDPEELEDADIEDDFEDESVAVADNTADLLIAEGDRAMQEGRFDDAMENYGDAMDHGSRRAIISLADLMIFSALFDAQGRKYWIGSDHDKDQTLGIGLTLYLLGSFYPECEEIVNEHLEVVQDGCANRTELEEMLQQISERLSAKITKDPIGFVKMILSQYNQK